MHRLTSRITWIIHAIACLAFLTLAAVGPAAHAQGSAAQRDYRVAVGDELNFRFFHTPELNTVAQVRSDGRVALPLLGEFVAEGMSMAELAAFVMKGLSPQVKRPEVTINLQGATTQRVFVGGEVGRPGMQPLLGPLTALQAVMVAEGLKETARASEVVVLRRGAQGGREVHRVNLAALMSGQADAQDLSLQPHDVVVVPKSGVADLNTWIDQYIRRNLPVSVGFSYSVNRGEVNR